MQRMNGLKRYLALLLVMMLCLGFLPQEMVSFAKAATATDLPAASAEAKRSEADGGQMPATPTALLPARAPLTLTETDGSTYRISVTYGEDAGLPEDAQLRVREIMPDSADYVRYLSDAAAANELGTDDFGYVRLFDISVVSAETGEEYTLDSRAEVAVELFDAGNDGSGAAEELQVIHFEHRGGGEQARLLAADTQGDTVRFLTDGFSVYAFTEVELSEHTITAEIEREETEPAFETPAHNKGQAKKAAKAAKNSSAQSAAKSGGTLYSDDLITLTGKMPKNGIVVAKPVSVEIEGEQTITAYDIKIYANANQQKKDKTWQPAGDRITVTVNSQALVGVAGEVRVYHLADEESEPELIAELEPEDGAVSFQAESFSAYAIVQGPGAIPVGWHKISDLDDLNEHLGTGLYIGHPDGYYYGNTTTGDSSRMGITKTKPAQSYPADAAALYYFEPVEDQTNQFYVYCYAADGVTKQYVYNGGNNSLSFTDAANKTAFTVTQNSGGTFKLNNGAWYWNMQGGASGTRFCSYNNANDNNNNVYFWYHVAVDGDPYDLDGKAYGLLNWPGATVGRAMMAEQSGSALVAKPLTVMTKKNNNADQLFVPNDSDITKWTFRWVEDDLYHLTADAGDGTKYLSVTAGGVSLADAPDESCRMQVVPGTGAEAGQIMLRAGSVVLTYSGAAATGFSVGGSAGSEWLYLAADSELTSDYFRTWSASKVSVSEPTVTNGSRLVLYTRVWNDTTKKYEFYAVDHDGSLVRCYESGDHVQWLGGQLNTLLWNFVEYYWEGTSDPNYYYELYNQYSERFIAPQVTGGQILSPDTIGINLNGRRNGYYQTPILAWDDGNYSYVGLKADLDTMKIVSCPKAEADNCDFYFAVMEEQEVDDVISTVPTVDHEQYGITVKLKDYTQVVKVNGQDTSREQDAVLGTNKYVQGKYAPGLLSTDLKSDGYPTAAATGKSLAELYDGASVVNHLFIKSTYSASGYYEFDSAQNFAHLITQEDLNSDPSLAAQGLGVNDFKVYREIGTYDSGGNKPSLKHGQFFPYNDIRAGVFASTNGKNLYDTLQRELPNTDPRKYEQLYSLAHDGVNANCYFGVELEASFTQTANGHDAWGHDIIYEFTGDDDFWLYVDGELVIDLGGIHSAMPGSVNYSTGEVSVNGRETTLRELFYQNYLGRGHTQAEAEAYVDGIFRQKTIGGETHYIFKDFSTHTMHIFYMERGAGASNLHMRFNLASVKPGTVELTKRLEGVDNTESLLAQFPYQIYYRTEGDAEEYLLSQGDALNINVNYKDTVNAVTYRPTFEVGGVTYQDVFLLKPGEIAVIKVPDHAIAYRIVECGVDTSVYESVTVEQDDALTGTDRSGTRRDYSLGYKSTGERPRVTFVNEVRPEAIRDLTITKKLYQEDGVTPIETDDAVFTYRLYLATEFDGDIDDTPANMHTYHVKASDGSYCRWDAAAQKFVSLGGGKTDYASLTDAEKTAASFSTSMNGSISKIPAGYTVEIRGLLAGTQFKVVERPPEIPDGYSFQKYVCGSAELTLAADGVSDTVSAGKDPHIDVCNIKGWGLRVNKVWSDADFMVSRAPAYFAVYRKSGDSYELLDTAAMQDENGVSVSAVRRMPWKDAQNKSAPQTLYWYFPTLPVSGTAIGDYTICEVTLTNPTADAAGNVTAFDGIERIGDGETIRLTGRQKGESADGSFDYEVRYEPGTVEAGSNVRIDTVGNSRPGLEIIKTKWDGAPLAGVTFALRDSGGSLLGTYTTDAEGKIPTLFLSSDDAAYTLTETATPQGWYGLQETLTLRQNSEGRVTVSGADETAYTLTQAAGATKKLTIKNRPHAFTAIKQGKDENGTMTTLSGARFALHRQKTVDGVTTIETDPMSGYENLVTGADGVIPRIDNTLPAGTYELRETAAPNGYLALGGYIDFTVSPTGGITLLSAPEGAALSFETLPDGTLADTLTVENERMLPGPTGISLPIAPFAVLLLCGVLLAGIALKKRRTASGGEE